MAKSFFQLHQYQEDGTYICNEVIGMFNLSIIAKRFIVGFNLFELFCRLNRLVSSGTNVNRQLCYRHE